MPRAAQANGEETPPQTNAQPKPDSNPSATAALEEKLSKPSKLDKPPVPEKKEDQPIARPVLPPIVKPSSPVEVIKKPAPPGKLMVKYRCEATEDQLRRQLATVPEVSLDRGKERTQAKRAAALAQAAKQRQERIETVSLLVKNRADLAGLPFLMGDDCHLTLTAAEHLQDGSAALRTHHADSAAYHTARARWHRLVTEPENVVSDLFRNS